jgi:tRNA threonylcarbamoyladenosine biosynthesis protein TsaB
MTKSPKSEGRRPALSLPKGPRSQVVGPSFGWTAESPGDDVVLAIDTSTRAGSVALCRGIHVLGEDTWQAGGHQSVQVLPAAQRLWERAGLTPGDLRLVVVATGPGSFTGLRVGASLGKGLALALHIPLVGVPTLDALAYQQAASGAAPARLIAVVGAGRGQYYAGTYSVVRRQLRREGEFVVLSSDELHAATRRPKRDLLVCGELDDIQEGDEAGGTGIAGLVESVELAEASKKASSGSAVRFASPAAGVRRAAFLAELGRWVFATEGPADAALLQPVYLRRSPGLGDAGQVPRG